MGFGTLIGGVIIGNFMGEGDANVFEIVDVEDFSGLFDGERFLLSRDFDL